MKEKTINLGEYNGTKLWGRFIERHQRGGRRSSYTIDAVSEDGSSFSIQCFGPVDVLPVTRMESELRTLALDYTRRWIDSNKEPKDDMPYEYQLFVARHGDAVVTLKNHDVHPDKPAYNFITYVSDYESGEFMFAIRGLIAEGYVLGKSEREMQEMMFNKTFQAAKERIDSKEYARGKTYDIGTLIP